MSTDFTLTVTGAALDSHVRALSDMNPGQTAYVTGLQVNGLLYRRLCDLGFVRGAEVRAVMESPAGDPIVYQVRGSRIALRRHDAERVLVDEKPPTARPCGTNGGVKSGCRVCPVAVRDDAGVRADADNANYLVALAGNPNTGKSTVFNALTGLRQHVGNWPGKTVKRAEGAWSYQGKRLKLVDLPGTYSLLSTSVEEEIARDFILFGAPDCTVVVLDATCLERHLNLAFQILEITDRVVVCVNLMDQARRRGITVDIKALSKRLGVPVVGTAARSGEGLDALQRAVLDVASGKVETTPAMLPCDDELEQAVGELLPYVEKAFPGLPNPRWIALRLIDGGDERLMTEVREGVLSSLPGQIGEQSLPGNASVTGTDFKH